MGNSDRITDEMQSAFNLEWFGCDQDGLIGMFETGGFAPIPESVAISNTNRKALVYFFKTLSPYTETIHHMNILSKIRLVGSSKKYFRSCDFWGRRGVFVYHEPGDPNTPSPYERVIQPVRPLHLDQLPIDYRSILEKIRLAVRFTETQQVPVNIIV